MQREGDPPARSLFLGVAGHKRKASFARAQKLRVEGGGRLLARALLDPRVSLSSILILSPFSSRNSVRERLEAEEEQVLYQVGPASPKEKSVYVRGRDWTLLDPARPCLSYQSGKLIEEAIGEIPPERTKAKKRSNQRTGGKEENEINP